MMRWLLLFLALVIAVPAHANVGQSYFSGDHTSEPTGLREIAIEHEDLRFDLRGDEPRIAAVYHLNNRGTATVTAPLVFVTGVVARSFELAFDNTPLSGEPLTDAQVAALPKAWNGPITTPALDGDGTLDYGTEKPVSFAFTLAIPPGKHELAVRYAARPEFAKDNNGGTIVYQLGYVLAPARDWGSFGTLDVTVEVPAGWRAATSPKLVRTGDTLHARFASLPADTIGITYRAPTGALHDILQYVLPLLALIVVGGGGYLLYALGRARGRSSELRPLWPVSLPASLLWAIAIGVSGGHAAMRDELALPVGQSAQHGYGNAAGVMLAVLVALLAIPIGVVLARAGARGGRE